LLIGPQDPSPCSLYKRLSWGPKAADAMIAADGGWHNPSSTASSTMPDTACFRRAQSGQLRIAAPHFQEKCDESDPKTQEIGQRPRLVTSPRPLPAHASALIQEL